ncbi:MAG: GTPase Era [Bdellovibrionales bacterium RIFOXYD1_FULL_44_7]|nr:MAG: GTPase Era [Bdellovibrionales bacterium RIFOXYD1_FULL_44_7]
MHKSGLVALVGRPNSGKSTLLNRILDSELSIVTPKAQTTRERLFGILTDEHLGQIIFTDTPGIHNAREGGINAFMMSEVREALIDVNSIWYLIDPGFVLKEGIRFEIPVLDLLSKLRAPVFILFNKIDLAFKPDLEKLAAKEKELLDEAAQRGVKIQACKRISAKSGLGVQNLLSETWELIPEGPLLYPDVEQISDKPVRFFVAEKVREQLFLQLGEELPYSSAVRIDKFEETATPVRIEATIFVERDSQKGMVIGSGGKKIKSIGQEARAKIEKFLGHQIFLGLKVDVLKNWTKDAEFLRRLGYEFKTKK